MDKRIFQLLRKLGSFVLLMGIFGGMNSLFRIFHRGGEIIETIKTLCRVASELAPEATSCWSVSAHAVLSLLIRSHLYVFLFFIAAGLVLLHIAKRNEGKAMKSA
jgi:hypothetical protein